MQEVGLAEAGVAIDEQRVVCLGRCFGYGYGRRVGKAVRSSDDEVIEVVFGVETGVVAPGVGWCLHPRGHGRLIDIRLVLCLGWTGEGVVCYFRIHHDGEIVHRNIVAQGGYCGEQGKSDALFQHSPGEVVRDFKIEGSRHDTLGFDKADEALQLGSYAFVFPQAVQY